MAVGGCAVRKLILAAGGLACLLVSGCGPLAGQESLTAQNGCFASAYDRLEPQNVDRAGAQGQLSPDKKQFEMTVHHFGYTFRVHCSLAPRPGAPTMVDWTVDGIQGALPKDKRYVVVADRWMTEGEVKQWLKERLSARSGEFAGQAWKSGHDQPAPCNYWRPAYRVIKSHDPTRQLYVCLTSGGEDGAIVMTQDGSRLDLEHLPADVAPR